MLAPPLGDPLGRVGVGCVIGVVALAFQLSFAFVFVFVAAIAAPEAIARTTSGAACQI